MIKIYCIKSTNCDEVYVSFTRGDISDIFNSYKNKYNSYKNGHGAFRKIFKIFECDDCYYIILEDVFYINLKERLMHYKNSNKCINHVKKYKRKYYYKRKNRVNFVNLI